MQIKYLSFTLELFLSKKEFTLISHICEIKLYVVLQSYYTQVYPKLSLNFNEACFQESWCRIAFLKSDPMHIYLVNFRTEELRYKTTVYNTVFLYSILFCGPSHAFLCLSLVRLFEMALAPPLKLYLGPGSHFLGQRHISI